MKDKFTSNKKAEAFDFIISEYFKNGFGALGKGDIDLIFYHALTQYGNLDETQKTDYELSKMLQITQARVRSLKIKQGLKYAPMDKQTVQEVFLEKAQFARLEEDGKRISIPVYDPNVFIELEHLIESQNGYVEVQLNPKIFTVRIDQFIGLLICFHAIEANKEVKAIQQEYVKSIQDVVKKEKKFSDKIEGKEGNFSFKQIQKNLLENGVEFGLELLVEAIPGGGMAKKLTETLFKSLFKK